MQQEIMDLHMQGYCCSQIIARICLSRMGKENPDLVEAMGGLCFGMNRGGTCGILSSAACMLYLHDAEEADQWQWRDFAEWFEESYGSDNCDELLEGNPINKTAKCPMMIENALIKLEELMEWED